MRTGIVALLMGLFGFAFAGPLWWVPVGALVLSALLTLVTFLKRAPDAPRWTWANTLAVAGVVLAGAAVARLVG